MSQPSFCSLDFYSPTIVESISPSSHGTYSIHPCAIFTLFYKGKEHEITESQNGLSWKCIVCIGIPDLFLKWTMKLFTKGVCMVYNNLLWMWITLFCQKTFLLQNCRVHTQQAGKELLFHCNIPHNLEKIEPLKSVPVMRSSSDDVMIEQSFEQAFHITLAWIKPLLLFLSCNKYLLRLILALHYLEEFFIFNVSIVSSPLSVT